MAQLALTIQRIAVIGERIGLAKLSRVSGVPYTTLVDWKASGWRPRAVQTLEKLAAAADVIEAGGAGE